MKTIGIIGGSTDVATAEYYKLINSGIRARLGDMHTGEIIINSMDLHHSVRFLQHRLFDEAAAYLHHKAAGLERAGADFILCVSNTWHLSAPRFMQGVSIPFLHIVDPTARAIRADGWSKVGLLGTKTTMAGTFLSDRYKEDFGIDIVVPTEEDQDFIDRIIFEELSFANFTDDSRDRYLAIIDSLSARGCQGVILGCTEIPLLVKQADRPHIPMYDTMTLHVEAAVALALEGHEEPPR